MNAKEALVIIANDKLRLGNEQEWWHANSFLQATKAAEPLLAEIERLRDVLRNAKEVLSMIFNPKESIIFEKIELKMFSSALVVEKYKKETLGEI